MPGAVGGGRQKMFLGIWYYTMGWRWARRSGVPRGSIGREKTGSAMGPFGVPREWSQRSQASAGDLLKYRG